MFLLGSIVFLNTQPVLAASSSCSQFIGQTKIMWNGVELKSGQIGRLTIVVKPHFSNWMEKRGRLKEPLKKVSFTEYMLLNQVC